MRDRLTSRANQLSSVQFFLAVFGPLLVIYLATAAWTRPYHIDAFTNVVTAWNMAEHQSLYLEDHEHLANENYRGNVLSIEAVDDRAVSRYPPGAALHAAPFYLLWPEDPIVEVVEPNTRAAPPVEVLFPPFGPAALTASLAVAVAMGLLGLTFRKIAASHVALVGAYVFGLGTASWSVAADMLWQHGPALLWISAGGLFASYHTMAAGGAYAVAILVRPPTALIPTALGLSMSWSRRSLRPALFIGVAAGIGFLAIVLYNSWVFGSLSTSGGYGAQTDSVLALNLGWYARNIWGALFDPIRGLLVYAPFLVPLLLGLREAWREAPDWVKGTALGGLAYFLVVYKISRFSGGGGYSTYRYPLEALTAVAPLLMISYDKWVSSRWLARSSLAITVILAVGMQALFAIGR